jgi:hypothetical protein
MAKATALDAMKVIVEALRPLDLETQHRVLSSAAALLGLPDLPLGVAPGRQWPAAISQQGPPSAEVARPKSIGELLKEKQPASNAQHIATFAYYRERIEGKPRFARGDLRPYYELAKISPDRNFDRDFTRLVKSGWIHEAGTESYLTSMGLEAVEAGFSGKSLPRGHTSKNSRKRTRAKK